MTSQRARIGCSGWSYDDWRWVEQVPGDFLFAVKASRYLTHMKRLREIADAVARFWEPLEPLRRGRRLGPVLWQLPENFHRDDDLLAGDDKRRPLPDARPTGAVAYLRLHYGHRGRGGNYSEAELDGWRRRIAAWLATARVRLPQQRLEGLRARQRPLPEAGLVGGRRGVARGMAADATTAAEFVPASRSLVTLRRAAAECRGCPLWKDATQTVFGAGPRKAELMLVGEQPGDRQDIEGAYIPAKRSWASRAANIVDSCAPYRGHNCPFSRSTRGKCRAVVELLI
jgi:Protein of unknown function DUF72